MGAVAAAIFGLSLFAQSVVVPPPSDGNPIVTPPSSGSTNTTNVTNVTNVFPAPDPQFVVQTEAQAGPVIIQRSLESFDSTGANDLINALDLPLELAKFRRDLILSPVVQEINNSMTRISDASLGLVVASLVLWGLIGTLFGSDGSEAFEFLGRVPLWLILARTSLAWYALMLEAFATLGTLIASSAHGAFGRVLSPSLWENMGADVFGLLVGLVMLIILLFFAIRVFANTAFLAFCAMVAPVFIFLKATPWTSRWGDNWFRMVPATAGDILAMLAMLVAGAAMVDHINSDNAVLNIVFAIGLVFAIPLVEQLFGLRNTSFGGKLWEILFIGRLRRAMRSAPTASSTPATATAASTTTTTRSPRWTS